MTSSSSKKLKKSIFIDALALVPDKKSGIGYSLEQTFKHFAALSHISNNYHIYLVVPLGKAKHLYKYLGPGISLKTIYLPARLLEVFLRLNIFPPMDWLLGRGTYIFPNYRNWSLWRSTSLTYIYDVGFIRYPETVQPKNQHYLRRYVKRWVARTDLVIAITNQMKTEIEKYLHVFYNKIVVVYCGVDTKVFYKRNQAQINAVKSKYKIPYDNYLLAVGNIEPRKNFLALLEAYAKLPTQLRNNYGLVFVGGDGWLNEQFYERLNQSQKSNHKILKVSDFVVTEDLPAIYSGATALIHPAIYEGFGLPPLEALACETPIAVSDIPAIREVIQDAGYYFDPKDITSITKALTKLISDKPDKQLHDQASTVVESFSWQASAQELSNAVDQLSNLDTKHPIVKRLKAVYVLLDRKFRALLGDKNLPPYRPPEVNTKQQLKNGLLDDFLAEQPSRLQSATLAIYLTLKHSTATIIKIIFKTVRS